MFTYRFFRNSLLRSGFAAMLATLALTCARSAEMNIRDVPLFLNDIPPPLNMLVLSRDHRLYYEAYNDASDLDGDGVLDVGYKPATITYYGYFETDRCYTYGGGLFSPSSAAGANKTCAGASEWSGDWLNYMTMSRIDALRKVLYGGLRYIDTDTDTVLQRAYIPPDAHSWGKEYESVARDGYDIRDYTPLDLPAAGRRHLFASTTNTGDGNETMSANPAVNGWKRPRFRYLANRQNRIWDWLSKERPVAAGTIDNSKVGGGSNDSLTSGGQADAVNYTVRVRVCSSGSYSSTSNCKVYASGNAKPTGLLQDYGEANAMYFGLITGSYGKPHDGGLLRRGMGSIRDEINLTTGTFKYNLATPGIINSIDRLRVMGFDEGGLSYGCGWITGSSDAAGNCSMWGNPTAEMMYESLRYFSGKNAPTSAFYTGANNTQETTIGLSTATWDANTNPYRSVATGGFASCSKPFTTVVSDISPSYDSDNISGSYFGSTSESFNGTTMNASSLGDSIWNNEIGASGNYFIGQSGSLYDGAPTVKPVTSFGNIRGLAPEQPAKEGSYNAGSVAYFGHQNDISAAAGSQKVQTFAVALASPLPNIKITAGGNTITLVPFAKSVGGSGWGIPATAGSYQPTNQIVDFYVDTLEDDYGKFRVNYEDVEQGADHDMDAIVTYEYRVNADNTVTVTLTSDYAAGGIIQHMGYVISGTTNDGTYLEVRDRDTAENDDPHFFLDTRPGYFHPSGGVPANDPNWNTGAKLQLSATRTFTASGAAAASYLKDPLWYAAKWGGFNDSNGNGRPDQRSEWATRAPAAAEHPDPDNYFLVTNALKLKEQLSQAFNDIVDRAGSASSASVSSGSISDDTRIYQATFDSRNWAGHLFAYPVGTGEGDTTEGEIGTAVWDAATQLPAPALRKILTIQPPATAGAADGVIPGSRAVAFRWGSIGAVRQGQLQPAADDLGDERLDYLRGDRTREIPAALPNGIFRRRTSALGDIVNSAPVFIGAPGSRYQDSMESAPYSSFVAANRNRAKMVYVGANDGMLHAFDAATGVEQFAYVPHGVFKNLYKLTEPTYGHLFYVDGAPSLADAFVGSSWKTVLVAGLNKGGQSVYALDVTHPLTVTEAGAENTVMWEFTDQRDADLGYTYSRPIIAKVQNGTWVAIFGNGYNNTAADGHASSTGNAVLYVVRLSDGALLRKIDTGVGMSQDPRRLASPNGLSSPSVVDRSGDGRSDTVYAGDLFGNMWKFDLSAADPASWDVAYKSGGTNVPLFVATNNNLNAWSERQRQPITTRAQVTRGPGGKGFVVLFGTGKFLEAGDRDVATLQVQSFYGIFDLATGTAATDVVATNRSTLLQQTITEESTYTWTDAEGTHSLPARATSNNALLVSHRGWYIDLLPPGGFQGEMQVTNSVLRAGRIVFTTLIPDTDICAYGGRSWVMDMEALSGSRLPFSPFDMNRDGEYDASDYVTSGGTSVAPSGYGVSAIVSTPAFLTGRRNQFMVTTNTSGGSGGGAGGGGEGASIDPNNPGANGMGRQSWRQLR